MKNGPKSSADKSPEKMYRLQTSIGKEGNIISHQEMLIKTIIIYHYTPLVLVVKNPPANPGDAGDKGSIPGPARSPGAADSNSLQYS